MNNNLEPGSTSFFSRDPRRAARLAGVFFLLAGVLDLINSLGSTPGKGSAESRIVDFVSIASGAIILSLPWRRFRYGATLFLLPIAFGLLVAGNLRSVDPFTYALYFVLVFAWIGLTQETNVALGAAPVAVAAYLVPLFAVHDSRQQMGSVAVAIPMSVLIASAISGALGNLRRSESRYRQTADLLAERETSLRMIFSHLPGVVWVTDRDLRFTQIAGAALYPSEADRGTGMGLAEYFRTDDASFPPLIGHRRALAGEEAGFEINWLDKAWSCHVQPLRNHSGDILGCVGLALDVTEQREAQESLVRNTEIIRLAFEQEQRMTDELRALDKMKTAFLASVSHELRTPLTAVLGISSTIRDQGTALSAHDQNELMDRLVANAQRLESLISDLLDLDGVVRGSPAPRRQLRNLLALGEEIVSEIDPKGHEITVQGTHEHGFIDPETGKRILHALLTNAIQYSPAGTPIVVGVAKHADGLLLSVDDEGPGVPDSEKKTIFEPFSHGAAALKHSPGLGVGLSLVARFAAEHGGRAWVDDRPGGGASFKVLLPEGGSAAVGPDALRE